MICTLRDLHDDFQSTICLFELKAHWKKSRSCSRMLITGMLVILDMGSLFVEDHDGGTTMVICCLAGTGADVRQIDSHQLRKLNSDECSWSQFSDSRESFFPRTVLFNQPWICWTLVRTRLLMDRIAMIMEVKQNCENHQLN